VREELSRTSRVPARKGRKAAPRTPYRMIRRKGWPWKSRTMGGKVSHSR
jgi:hypothetical protein